MDEERCTITIIIIIVIIIIIIIIAAPRNFNRAQLCLAATSRG